jgi:hypothetical protein
VKNFLSVLYVVLCLLDGISAQQILGGRVTDASSQQPLEGVSIYAAPTLHALSDRYGNFFLKSNADTIAVQLSFIGYESKPEVLNAHANTTIGLWASPVNLKDVVLQTTLGSYTNIVNKIDLDLKPVRNTQELLRLVPGLFIAQHAGGGKAEQVFLRGFDSDHGTDVQVSMDGLPVNMVSHAHGQGYADAHFIIPECIRSVDFGAGPYYTQHGNLNTAGYVAFSSFDQIEKSRVQLEAGLYNSYRALTMLDLLRKNRAKQAAYIAAEYNCTNGPTISKQQFGRFNIFGKYNLAISDHTHFTASLSSFESSWNASGQVPSRAVKTGQISRFGSIDPSEGGNTSRQNANFLLSHRFSNGLEWENQAYYSRYSFSLFSNFTFFLNDPVNGDEINQAEKRNLFGYLTRLRHHWLIQNWTMESFAGAGLRKDATEGSSLSNAASRRFTGYTRYGDISETNLYAYAQQRMVAGKWLIDAGIRLDQLSFRYLDRLSSVQLDKQRQSVLSPKLNIQYTVSPKVQVFIKSGKGFHSNDARVVVANSGREILPAAYGSDVGVTLKPSGNLFLSVAAWNLYLAQEFVYVGDEGVVEPSGRTKRLGLDLLARYQFNKHIFAHLNLNLTRARARGGSKGQDYIPLAPLATSTGGLFYKNKKGINGSISYRYMGSRPANEDYSIIAKGYTLIDASVNYTMANFEIGCAMENLLNVKWNEAQFATRSRLFNEPLAVTELNFTPGTPFFARVKFAVFF